MNVEVVMPQLGLTMTEGTVSEWLKKSGDKVQKNEPLFVVSTDKTDMEVESSLDGTLGEILIPQGQTVPVGTVLAYVEQPDGKTNETKHSRAADGSSRPAGSQQAAGLANVPRPSPILVAAKTKNNGPPASPRARRLARELGLDLSTVQGSGPGGRIAEADLRKGSRAPLPRATATDLSRRRIIAEKMTESIQTIPHFSVAVEVDAQQLIAMYESLREPVEKSTGLKLSLTDLLLKALAIALLEVPEVNAVWAGGAIQSRKDVHLGLAVATERGVVAPVLRNVDRIGLAEMLVQRNHLMERARGGRLSLTDLEGAVGTLSNLGMYRVDSFQAIITPGQSFVLAVGKIKNRPWVDTALVMRPTALLNLSMDHRVADGAAAARLLGKIAEIIEKPYQINWNTGKSAQR